ncbi:hypothetical protein D3C87_1390180 [compost metagenome]
MADLTRGEKIFRKALYAAIALLVLGTGLMVAMDAAIAPETATVSDWDGPTGGDD